MRDYNEELLVPGFMLDLRSSLPRNYAKAWPRREPEDLKGVVFHQSLEDYGTAWGNAKYHAGPNHISKEGLPGLSYTIFVDRKTGKAVLANDVECATYSHGNRFTPGNENQRFIGVCFGGNFSGPGYTSCRHMGPTQEQKRVMELLWPHLAKVFGFLGNQLYGHYHFGKPACPGHEIAAYIETIRGEYYENSDLTGVDLSDNRGRQTLLMKLGFYWGKVDGLWGPQSKYALIQCQRMLGLEVDGVWGVRTEEAILAELG